MAKRIYKTPYIATIQAYSTEEGVYNEFIVRRYFDNIFHMKYYLEHYKDKYGEKFTILRVLKKERAYDNFS